MLNLLFIFVCKQIYNIYETAWEENLVEKVLWVGHNVTLLQYCLQNLKNLFSYEFIVLVQFERWNALVNHKFLKFFKLGFAISFLEVFDCYNSNEQVRNALSHVHMIEQVLDDGRLLI